MLSYRMLSFKLQDKKIIIIPVPISLALPSQAPEKFKLKISAHVDGGPRSRVCARETLRSAPHRRERKFSGARVCTVTFWKFSHFPVKIGLFWGVGGSPIFLLESSSFCYLGAHAKIWNPTTTSSGVLNNGIKKSRTTREKKINLNSKKSGKVALKQWYVYSSRARNHLVTVTLESIGVNNLPNF